MPCPPLEEGRLYLRSLNTPLGGLCGEGGIIAVEVDGRPEPGLALLLAARKRFVLGGVILPLSGRGSLLPGVRIAEVGGEAFAREAAVGLLNPPLSPSRSRVAEADRGGCCPRAGEAARFARGDCLLDSPIEGRSRFENLAVATPRLRAACCVAVEAALLSFEGDFGAAVLFPDLDVFRLRPTRGSMSNTTGRGSFSE